MISAWEIYLFTRIDAINTVLGLLMFCSLVTFGVMISGAAINRASSVDYEIENKTGDYKTFLVCLEVAKKSLWVVIPAVLLNVAMPNQKEFAAMYIIPKIANSQTTQEIAGNLTGASINASKLLLGKTQEWLGELDNSVKIGK